MDYDKNGLIGQLGIYLTIIIRRRRIESMRILPETKSMEVFANIH